LFETWKGSSFFFDEEYQAGYSSFSRGVRKREVAPFVNDICAIRENFACSLNDLTDCSRLPKGGVKRPNQCYAPCRRFWGHLPETFLAKPRSAVWAASGRDFIPLPRPQNFAHRELTSFAVELSSDF